MSLTWALGVAGLASTAAIVFSLAACGGPSEVRESGPDPELPSIRQSLVPTIKIARPAEWGDEVPTVPEGFTITFDKPAPANAKLDWMLVR